MADETDKVGTLSNHISRDPEELEDLIAALEDAGYEVTGPLSRDRLGIDGSEHNDWYWIIREAED